MGLGTEMGLKRRVVGQWWGVVTSLGRCKYYLIDDRSFLLED